MATVLPAQAALNAKLNRSRPTQKERKLIRQQQQQVAHDHTHDDANEHYHEEGGVQSTVTPLADALDWLALTDASNYRTTPVVFTPDSA